MANLSSDGTLGSPVPGCVQRTGGHTGQSSQQEAPAVWVRGHCSPAGHPGWDSGVCSLPLAQHCLWKLPVEPANVVLNMQTGRRGTAGLPLTHLIRIGDKGKKGRGRRCQDKGFCLRISPRGSALGAVLLAGAPGRRGSPGVTSGLSLLRCAPASCLPGC